MTPRENALAILRFGHPERVTGCLPTTQMAYAGANHEDRDGIGHDRPLGSTWQDLWGVGWEIEHAGVMGFPKRHPLADLPRDLPGYRWPDPHDPVRLAPLAVQKKGWDPTATFLAGSHRDTLWERTYMLLGMENAMLAFYEHPALMREVLRRIMDFQLGIAAHYLDLGIEVAQLGDDLGTQHDALLSPDLVREFLVPEYRRLIDLYRRHGVIVNFHSCGCIMKMVDIFLDLGIDVLNPVQANANDLPELRRRTQGRLALIGGVSSGLLVSGPLAAIRRAVAEALWTLGRDGGYFCSPDQGMPWPKEHYQTFTEAREAFGCYPLRDPQDLQAD